MRCSRAAGTTRCHHTIALGVGAVTTLFSVAYGVLLRPLSWANGDGLVRVIESRDGREGRIAGKMMNGSFLAWNEAPQTIESIGSWTDGTVTLTGFGDATRVTVTNVSPSSSRCSRAADTGRCLRRTKYGRQRRR